jgi:preprotein translocase subunit SecG
MIILLTILHIIVSLFLILVVLLQTGKGADLAGAFGGGGSQTAFGARGATTLLHKITTGAAATFMATSLVLAIVASRPSSSVVEDPNQPAAPTAVDEGTVPGPESETQELDPGVAPAEELEPSDGIDPAGGTDEATASAEDGEEPEQP